MKKLAKNKVAKKKLALDVDVVRVLEPELSQVVGGIIGGCSGIKSSCGPSNSLAGC